IIFTPQAGVFNPSLDIVLQTEITEVDEEDVALVDSESNEIPDPLSTANNADTITVFLNILGETTEILPNLRQQNTDCDIRPSDTPLVENNQYYSDKELNRLTQCFNKTALIDNSNDQNQIINSPAVELTSVPSRSQGELIGLFGKTFLAFAEQVKNSSQSELFDLGVNQFVLAPVRRNVLYRVDDTVVGIGQQVGLDYLRVFPNLEGIVELDQNSSVRSTYNYTLEEVRVQYERRF
ncbi:MAG: translocation/assembly module TamB domain-containing protein, partial [Waterburya sp.]